MPMMVQSTAKNSFAGQHPNTNAMIVAIDPAQTTGLEEFQKANSEFMVKIKATRARKGEKIRIPGEQAVNEKDGKLKSGLVDIPQELWQEIKSL